VAEPGDAQAVGGRRGVDVRVGVEWAEWLARELLFFVGEVERQDFEDGGEAANAGGDGVLEFFVVLPGGFQHRHAYWM